MFELELASAAVCAYEDNCHGLIRCLFRLINKGIALGFLAVEDPCAAVVIHALAGRVQAAPVHAGSSVEGTQERQEANFCFLSCICRAAVAVRGGRASAA